MLLGVLSFGMYPIPLYLGVLTVDGIFSFSVPSSLNFHPLMSPWRPISSNVEWIYVKLVATNWSNREVDPVATTVVRADAPSDKTGHNVINNGTCQ